MSVVLCSAQRSVLLGGEASSLPYDEESSSVNAICLLALCGTRWMFVPARVIVRTSDRLAVVLNVLGQEM